MEVGNPAELAPPPPGPREVLGRDPLGLRVSWASAISLEGTEQSGPSGQAWSEAGDCRVSEEGPWKGACCGR